MSAISYIHRHATRVLIHLIILYKNIINEIDHRSIDILIFFINIGIITFAAKKIEH